MINQAQNGDTDCRDEVARIYTPLIESFLHNRWRQTPLVSHIDDARQEILFELFRADGALDRFDRKIQSAFRPFLYGVVRNVVRRAEDRQRRLPQPAGVEGLGHFTDDDRSLSQMFDRLWAENIIRQTMAAIKDDQLVDILRMRFYDGLPVREIAKQLKLDPARVHKMYANARSEFKYRLKDVFSFNCVASDTGFADQLQTLLLSFE